MAKKKGGKTRRPSSSSKRTTKRTAPKRATKRTAPKRATKKVVPKKKGRSPPTVRKVAASTSYSFRGKKAKKYKFPLTPKQQGEILKQAAVRDFIRAEKLKGRRLTWDSAQKDTKYLEAIDALRVITRTPKSRRTYTQRVNATKALKTLGRLPKSFRGVYF